MEIRKIKSNKWTKEYEALVKEESQAKGYNPRTGECEMCLPSFPLPKGIFMYEHEKSTKG